MYYRVTGQEIYAEWKEKELRVKESGKKIYKIEGEVEFKEVKTVLSQKLGYAEDRIKIIKFKNSPELHKKVESIFSDNSEKEFDEKIEKIISEEVKEVKETEKEELEKQAIELMEDLEKDKVEKEIKRVIKTIEVVEIPQGESEIILSEAEKFCCRNVRKDYFVKYTNEEKEMILSFQTTKEETFIEFIESFIFKYRKKVKLGKIVIKNLNEFSKFLLENELLFSGNEIMVAPTLEKFKLEELEEKFGVKLEI